jgi:hypothetical protein
MLSKRWVAAETSLDGAMVAGRTAELAEGGVRLQHVSVLEELSRITGIPQLAGV